MQTPRTDLDCREATTASSGASELSAITVQDRFRAIATCATYCSILSLQDGDARFGNGATYTAGFALALQGPYIDTSVVYLREDIYDCLAQPPLLHRAQEVEVVWFHLYPNKAFSCILHAPLESSGGRLTSRKPLTFM